MPNYVYFLLAVAGLIVGYIIYGSIVAKIFGADENRPTPAKTMADGVDYVEMPRWKVWLIQLLNIARLRPHPGRPVRPQRPAVDRYRHHLRRCRA